MVQYKYKWFPFVWIDDTYLDPWYYNSPNRLPTLKEAEERLEQHKQQDSYKKIKEVILPN